LKLSLVVVRLAAAVAAAGLTDPFALALPCPAGGGPAVLASVFSSSSSLPVATTFFLSRLGPRAGRCIAQEGLSPTHKWASFASENFRKFFIRVSQILTGFFLKTVLWKTRTFVKRFRLVGSKMYHLKVEVMDDQRRLPNNIDFSTPVEQTSTTTSSSSSSSSTSARDGLRRSGEESHGEEDVLRVSVGNPFIEVIKGTIHIYKHSTNRSVARRGQLPVPRVSLLFSLLCSAVFSFRVPLSFP